MLTPCLVSLFILYLSLENNNGKFTIGADAAAAAGPVGRQASAGTDVQLRAEIYSYSRSRGLFAGVSLDGSTLEIDHGANGRFYAGGAVPAPATRLLEQLASYTPQAALSAGPQGVDGPTPAGPSAIGGAAGESVRLKQELAAASTQLQKLLDTRWQAFLALPAEVYAADGHPALDVITPTLSRFNNLASDSGYASLSGRPEFQQVHRLLQQYVTSLTPRASSKLQLPPPPRY